MVKDLIIITVNLGKFKIKTIALNYQINLLIEFRILMELLKNMLANRDKGLFRILKRQIKMPILFKKNLEILKVVGS